jgi:hypothetical protein
MLVIREAQIRVLSTLPRSNFIERLAAHAAALDTQAGADELDASVEKAASFGLRSERDLWRWIGLCCQFGFDFTDRPENGWMRAILEDTRVTRPTSRLQRLMALCMEREEIARQNERLRQEFLQK